MIWSPPQRVTASPPKLLMNETDCGFEEPRHERQADCNARHRRRNRPDLCAMRPRTGCPRLAPRRVICLVGRHGSCSHDWSDDSGRSFSSSHDTPEKWPNPGSSRAIRADTGPSTEPKPGSYLKLGAVEKNAPAWHGKLLQGEQPEDDWLNGFGDRLDGQPHWDPKYRSSTDVGTHFHACITGMEVQ